MPAIAGMLALCVLLLIGYFISNSSKNAKREFEQEQQQKELQNNLLALEDRFNGLEKRLGNIELIVTDSKFVDPPSDRQAIDLKSEITELKSIIMNLNK